MKASCPKCNKEIGYPFNKCKECSWKATGKYAKKSKEFAEKYRKDKGRGRGEIKINIILRGRNYESFSPRTRETEKIAPFV